MAVTIRAARDADMATITAIYAHHVLHGTASFEEQPPSEAEITARWQQRERQGFPTLVAERQENAVSEHGVPPSDASRVVGFAYVNTYKERSAYRFTVEDSIYLADGCQRQGIGSQLLAALLLACRERGYQQVMAVIGGGEGQPSLALHARMGFRMVGVARRIGFKFGRWLDVHYMQCDLSGAQDTEEVN